MTTPARPRRLRRPLTQSPSHTPYPDHGRAEFEPRTRPVASRAAPQCQPHHTHMVAQAGDQGRTLAGMARHLGITKYQLLAWMEDNVEFRMAVYDAQERAQMWWEERLREQALEGNAAATQFAMKNMFPDSYRERREVKVEGDVFEIEYIDLDGYDESADDTP